MEKLNKKYVFLIIIVVVGLISGIVFSNILNANDEKIVITKITQFFNNLKEDIQIDYISNLFTSLKNNIIYLVIIWVLGLSIIGLVINNFLLFFKSFILGFSIGGIINIYLYRGIILSILYIFPALLMNIFIFVILIYYANNFSINFFRVLFLKKEVKFAPLLRKYTKILFIMFIFMIISSILETFLTPFIIKLFSFLIK